MNYFQSLIHVYDDIFYRFSLCILRGSILSLEYDDFVLLKDAFTKKLAERIKTAREESGMSQEELSHQAGLYRTYVGHLENAKYTPTAYVLYKISKALKIKADSLLPGQ